MAARVPALEAVLEPAPPSRLQRGRCSTPAAPGSRGTDWLRLGRATGLGAFHLSPVLDVHPWLVGSKGHSLTIFSPATYNRFVSSGSRRAGGCDCDHTLGSCL